MVGSIIIALCVVHIVALYMFESYRTSGLPVPIAFGLFVAAIVNAFNS